MNSPVSLLVPLVRARRPVAARRIRVPMAPGAAAAALCAALSDVMSRGPVLAVTAGPLEMDRLADDWHSLCPERAAAVLDPVLDDGAERDLSRFCRRVEAMRALSAPARVPGAPPGPAVILTCIQALLCRQPDPDAVDAATLRLETGMAMGHGTWVERLAAAGYQRETDVYRPGGFAVRGGILDLWPPGRTLPLRIECFGDRVETVREFDPATQRSRRDCPAVSIPPARFGALTGSPSGIDPLRRLGPEAVFLWLDPGVLDLQAERFRRAVSGRDILSARSFAASLRAARPVLEVFVGESAPAELPEWDPGLRPIQGLSDTGAGGAPPDAMAARRIRLLRHLIEAAHTRAVWVFVDTDGIRAHLEAEIAALPSGVRDRPPDAPAVPARGAGRRSAAAIAPPGLKVCRGILSGGFDAPAAGWVVVAQSDLYGRRQSAALRVPRHVPERGAPIEAAESIRPGELVVHVEHGIGRFLGLNEVSVGAQRAEVMTLEYADGLRLHVPVAQAHLLSRYVGVGRGRVVLHRLGGKRWRRERGEAETAVADLAAALLETQAQRNTQPGFAFDPAPPWMAAFEHAFPYVETPDQTRAIAEVKTDMAAARPMDRLLCGDAGYGKTEVAMRAAFIAVMQGKQVAVLAPTTVLVDQHEETFRERMAPYPVRIEALSRFRSAARRRDTLRALAAGRVDILIGAHALLAPGVAFRDLGLVIIDEEQRFGVRQKEQLKTLRRMIDVLTLTATPIPRTLYMSMTGARDLSLLQTPPRDRVAVETRVAEESDAVIREALRRELGREGQSFVLHNRVATIERMRRRLERLVPEARIAVAHGQMPARALASVMHAFVGGSFDVLLCTTLVESGLDIPRANTILILRADRFGIADLYQLRGRVGRAARPAHAWLLLPPGGPLAGEARDRIRALQRHGGLGAGFELAVRDLEIRGAGNLLGAAQSGHIAAVGFGLYCRLLRRSVARLQGRPLPPPIDVTLRLDFLDLSPGAPGGHGAALPYDYVEDESQRIALHRRLAEAVHLRELQHLGRELRDRFGPVPPPARRWLRLGELRILAAARGIECIECRRDRLTIYRDGRPLQTGPPVRFPETAAADARLVILRHSIRALPVAKRSRTADRPRPPVQTS